jgi:hypothetical protein
VHGSFGADALDDLDCAHLSTTIKGCANDLACCSPRLSPCSADSVNVEIMNQRDFSISYFALAKRYHLDRNPQGAELMAKINAARAAILDSYRSSAP